MKLSSIETQIQLTVCILTFNHENYIAKCIDSILSQETTFQFEVVIADDCSTDNTWSIVSDYISKYPGTVSGYRQQTNIGGCANFCYLYNLATKKYVAYLDGDDWALPGKLQKQFNILESNPKCNVVLHAVDTLKPDGSIFPSEQTKENYPIKFFTQKDLVNYTWIGAHSSKMCRQNKKFHNKLNDEFLDFYVIFDEIGSGLGYFDSDQAYGVYREGVGVCSNNNVVRNILIKHVKYIHEAYPAYKDYICSAAISLVYSDVRNRSSTLPDTLQLVKRTLTIRGLWLYISTFVTRRKVRR